MLISFLDFCNRAVFALPADFFRPFLRAFGEGVTQSSARFNQPAEMCLSLCAILTLRESKPFDKNALLCARLTRR